MHNQLKFFRDTEIPSLFNKMESFMLNEHVSGKSISIEHAGDQIIALLGYEPGNDAKLNYKLSLHNLKTTLADSDEATQNAINAVADLLGNFICQSVVAIEGELSIAFLTGK